MSKTEKHFWFWALLVTTALWLVFGRGAGDQAEGAAADAVDGAALSARKAALSASSTSAEYRRSLERTTEVYDSGAVPYSQPAGTIGPAVLRYVWPDGSITSSPNTSDPVLFA